MKGKKELKEFLSVALELMRDGTVVGDNAPLIMHKLQQVRMKHVHVTNYIVVYYLYARLSSAHTYSF